MSIERIELRLNKQGKYYLRLKGANNETVLVTQAYANRAIAKRSAAIAVRIMKDGPVIVEYDKDGNIVNKTNPFSSAGARPDVPGGAYQKEAPDQPTSREDL